MGIRHSDHWEPESPSVKIYACQNCKTHLATSKMIISRDYRGRTGKAYLLKNVINIKTSKKITKEEMTTGKYLIRYIYCHQCGSNIGWKYIKADERDQLYKQGRYIMEIKRVCCTV